MAIRSISIAVIAGAALTSCAPTGSTDQRSGEPIEPGAPVMVRAVSGLVLEVEPNRRP